MAKNIAIPLHAPPLPNIKIFFSLYSILFLFNVSKNEILKRIEPLKHSSDKLWKFAESMIEDAHERGLITNPEK